MASKTRARRLTGTLMMAALSGCMQPVAAQLPLLNAGTAMTATRTPPGTRYRVTAPTGAKRWDRIERLTSTVAAFPDEHMRPNGRQLDADIVTAFGTATPPSRDVLLHYGKGWETGKGVPVLLVHGALLDATNSWATPHDHEGLAPTLAAKGSRVFAVTFAHRHGDNFLWAEQINNAVARIKAVTGASEVDVVAHSKGCAALRALLSDYRLPWMAPYHHDIRRVVFIGGAHKGIDYTFRHPLVNLGLYPEQDGYRQNAPMSWDKMLVYGIWKDTSALTATRGIQGFFPGQAQLLARWDKTFPLPTLEPDWYTTYHGGQGLISQSSGIDDAIAAGGHFMAKLGQKSLDSAIRFANLAGSKQDLANVLNETSGPSDGVVFVASATAIGDLTRGGATCEAKKVLPLNHMALIYDPTAKSWIADFLK